MKRATSTKSDENSDNLQCATPSKKAKRGPRGPYMKWAKMGLPMPTSTYHNRLNKSCGTSSYSPRLLRDSNYNTHNHARRIKVGQRGQSSESCPIPPVTVMVKNPAEPTIEFEENAGFDSAILQHSVPPVQVEPAADLQYVVQECHELPDQFEREEIVEEPEQERDQTETSEMENLAELDGFQVVDSDSKVDDNGDDAHSEESFIQQDEDDNISVTSQSEDQPDDPPNDNSISDEEMLEAPDVPLSLNEKIHLLMLLATMKRHNMSYTTAEDVMELADVLAGNEDNFKTSRHLMKVVIDRYSCSLTVHHMCPSCGKYVGIVTNPTFICCGCRTDVNTAFNRKKGNVFLYLSLRDQLIFLLEQYSDRLINVTEREKINECNYEDIYDGEFYTKLIKNGELTFNFFVDGLQVASTSKRSAWPVLVCLNELPVHLRRRHILMTSLWLGLKKPLCNEYLKPFVAECIELQERGITFLRNGIRSHKNVQALVCVSDTIARPMLRNSIQFNGRYGCGLCMHPGIRLRHQRGHIRSYSIRNGEYPLRTHDEIMAWARRARIRHPVMGIKGISILSNIPNFDMARCLDLDLFHALVNVAKRFANLWFLEKFSGRPYNVSDKFAEIDARFLQITPSSEVSRVPRSLKDRSDFRGHEWFHWVIEYSVPVLKYYLPARYLNHWALLVHGIVLVMQNSVAQTELIYSGRYIKRFVSEIDNLYGWQHVTISVHLLSHLQQSVKDFGQPWSHSAFIFEAFNAEIKQAVKSSNGVTHQICKAMQRKIALPKLEDDIKDYLSDRQLLFLEKMKFTGLRLGNPHLVIGPAALMGKPRESGCRAESIGALQRAGIQCTEESLFLFYDRCVLHGEMYHSTNYKRVFKINNSVVLLDSDQVFMIKTFLVFQTQCYVLGNYFCLNRHQKLCDDPLPHIKVLKERKEGVERCFPVSKIQSKLLSFFIRSPSKESLRVACVNVLGLEMLR